MTAFPDRRWRSLKACPFGDWGGKKLWKGETRSGVGNSPVDNGPPLGIPRGPFPGEMHSIAWKVPLYRDDCRAACPLDEAVEDVELVPPRFVAVSNVLRLGPRPPGPPAGVNGSTSTTMGASLTLFCLPLRRFLASWAAFKVPNRAIADRYPLSFGDSVRMKSAPIRSFANNNMVLKDSWLVFRGRLRIRIAEGESISERLWPLSVPMG